LPQLFAVPPTSSIQGNPHRYRCNDHEHQNEFGHRDCWIFIGLAKKKTVFTNQAQLQATKFPQIRDPFNRENPSNEGIVLRMAAGH